jgi:hypothetical protein
MRVVTTPALHELSNVYNQRKNVIRIAILDYLENSPSAKVSGIRSGTIYDIFNKDIDGVYNLALFVKLKIKSKAHIHNVVDLLREIEVEDV